MRLLHPLLEASPVPEAILGAWVRLAYATGRLRARRQVGRCCWCLQRRAATRLVHSGLWGASVARGAGEGVQPGGLCLWQPAGVEAGAVHGPRQKTTLKGKLLC